MKQLQGLLAFVETATAGSLTAAARRLEVTPAAVSKSVLRLEAQLGVRLFNRSTRKIALTDEGARFLVEARGALRLLDDAVANVSRDAVEPAGRVRISVGIAFGRKWVLPALPKLLAKHRTLKVEVDLDNRPVDLVAEGYDIGIRGGASEDSSLVARKICKLPVVLVASPGYLKQAGIPARAADLAAHRCIALVSAGSRRARGSFGAPSIPAATRLFHPTRSSASTSPRPCSSPRSPVRASPRSRSTTRSLTFAPAA